MKKTKNGFTMIEVTLVLALGALIFMMVFVALPQMRRQQRDTERKDDVMLLVESIKKFQTNNRGALPSNNAASGDTSWNGFMTRYVDENFGSYGNVHKTFVDPDGEDYMIAPPDGSYPSYDTIPFDYTMHIYTQATCDDEGQRVKQVNNPRTFVVLYRTESSGVYCQAG